MDISVNCTIVKQIYANNNYRIFGCILNEPNSNIQLNKYGNFTITGDLAYLTEGQSYEMILNESKTSNYGVQYEVKSVPSLNNISDLSSEEEFEILKSITTQSQATYVHKAYPDFIKRVLREEENTININNIYNVGEYRLNIYIREIKEKFKYYKLIQQYPDFKFTVRDCSTLEKLYNTMKEIQQNIDKNPYKILTHDLKRSFNISDKIIIKVRPELINSNQRTEYGIIDILKRNEIDGNTKINANEMYLYVKDLIPECKDKIVQVTILSDSIYYNPQTKETALKSTYIAESTIAYKIKNLINSPIHSNMNVEEFKKHFTNKDLTEEQEKILDIANEQSIGILNGPAGSGKTHSIRALIEMLEYYNLSYILLAPTGTAAKKLSEATGRPAFTIHKALNIVSDNMPLQTIDKNFVIVDEFSMCDVNLTCSLLESLTPNITKIIFVCDDAQLPSISCGNVLKDILDTKLVPTSTLTKIFRYGIGGIATVATEIRKGRPYLNDSGKPLLENNWKDYKFISIQDNPLEQITQEYDNLIKEGYTTKDIMVLSPFNIGDFGTFSINQSIQSKYNPLKNKQVTINKNTAHGKIAINFRVGDKVINTVNTYDALTEEEYKYNKNIFNIDSNENTNLSFKKVDIMNGDIGYIREIDENENLYVQIDENMIVFTSDTIKNLLLAYSISTHKSQGGQAKAVISINHPHHKRMLTRNLLYVAGTRAKEKLIEIGDIRSINNALKINAVNERETFLKELLINE